MRLLLERLKFPVSPLNLVTDEQGNVRVLEFADHESRMHHLLRRHYNEYDLKEARAPKSIRDAIERYFQGDLEALDALTTATGGTPFQRKVWAALRTIPAGTTISYGQLAGRIGRPGSSRAVGAANGQNPIAIIVPCHRVIGADGTLTGYASGLSHKRWLLDHENRYAPVLTGT